MITLYIFFYIFALIAEQLKPKDKQMLLMLTCVVMALLAGFRDPSLWADTGVYVMSFEYFTHPLYEWSQLDEPFGYSEYGFYFLGVIFKTFSSNATFYLTFIAALTFIFMYKDFRRYCYYPLFGVAAYISRFYLARNFIQIRAGLSYAIILWAVQYISELLHFVYTNRALPIGNKLQDSEVPTLVDRLRHLTHTLIQYHWPNQQQDHA